MQAVHTLNARLPEAPNRVLIQPISQLDADGDFLASGDAQQRARDDHRH
jgi:hypothetical protein